jgi:UDP-N-acetylglucosamine--N-acetylmuramyl-(pentapeptide) pyrophosphoryl-undecaprenol N-acetylglucosamine transferase
MKAVITGGHHNSALVIAQRLRKEGFTIYWIGQKTSMAKDKNESAEFREVTKNKFSFYDLKTGKFYRTFNPFVLAKIPLGFFKALIFLLKIKPQIIISFGSYVAVPVVISGWFLRIPSVTHEQTQTGGWSNKAISPFVKKIFLTWKKTDPVFPSHKIEYTGLPLRKEISIKKTKKFDFPQNLPTLFIIGGKQGSHIINNQIFRALPQLLTKFNLIHQCGITSTHNDFQKAINLRKALNPKLRQRYKIDDYIDSNEIGAAFRNSHFVLSRSGAHITQEIAALGKPAILIPYPYVPCLEQQKNAEILESKGIAKIISQNDLTANLLLKTILNFYKNLENYKRNSSKAKEILIKNAEEKFIISLQKIINKNVQTDK